MILAAEYCGLNPSIGTVVHPKAAIFALGGPIIIGTNCILEEGTIIVNR